MSTYLHVCQWLFTIFSPFFILFFLFQLLGAFSFRRVALGARWLSHKVAAQTNNAESRGRVAFKLR